ncbi:MAG: hypothetical protein ACRCS9_16040 [Hyphomicrobium sp.]
MSSDAPAMHDLSVEFILQLLWPLVVTGCVWGIAVWALRQPDERTALARRINPAEKTADDADLLSTAPRDAKAHDLARHPPTATPRHSEPGPPC